MHPVSCTNTHHDVTDLVNHGMVKSLELKTEKVLKKSGKSPENGKYFFYEIKKNCSCASDDTFLEIVAFSGCNL